MAIALATIAIIVPLGIHLDEQRVDLFYLADALAHGRTWVPPWPWIGPADIIPIGGRVYLPFGPMPAILMAPLAALTGPAILASFHVAIAAVLTGLTAALAWLLLARFDRGQTAARLWVVVLFVFSSPLWIAGIDGGPWHQDQLVALIATILALLEATARRRSWLMGLLVGAAFLSRAPVALALPFFIGVAASARGRPRDRIGWRQALSAVAGVVVGFLPALGFYLWYNTVRLGSPFDSGYALATLTQPVLVGLRDQGLFSLAHVPWNLVLLFLYPPMFVGPPFWFGTNGLGLSIFLTSPGLFFAWRARWRDPFVLGAAATAVLVLIPSLLYYGGGFYQIGFRYLLDSWPFLLVLLGSAARNGMPTGWKAFVLAGVLVNAWLILQV